MQTTPSNQEYQRMLNFKVQELGASNARMDAPFAANISNGTLIKNPSAYVGTLGD